MVSWQGLATSMCVVIIRLICVVLNRAVDEGRGGRGATQGKYEAPPVMAGHNHRREGHGDVRGGGRGDKHSIFWSSRGVVCSSRSCAAAVPPAGKVRTPARGASQGLLPHAFPPPSFTNTPQEDPPPTRTAATSRWNHFVGCTPRINEI